MFAFSAPCLATPDGNLPQATCVDLEHLSGTTQSICEKHDLPYLLLEFFSAHCGYCRRNVPMFKHLEEVTKTKAHSRLVSLNSREDATSFQQQFAITTDIALDLAQLARKGFSVTGVPILFVLNASNQIVFAHVGGLDEATIVRIANLVGARTSNDGGEQPSRSRPKRPGSTRLQLEPQG